MANKYAVWSSKDQDGSFKHVGRVVKTDKKTGDVTLATMSGTMVIPADDGKMSELPGKPEGFTIQTKGRIKRKRKPVKVVKVAPVKRTGPSKKSQAFAIYDQRLNTGRDTARASLIQAFIDELDMTKAGASTYAAMVRKQG